MAERKYNLETVGRVRIVQLYADGFELLTSKERIFAYYLTLAARAARDISVDQHHRHAIELRDLFEGIYRVKDNLEIPAHVKQNIETYTKLLWIGNGPYDSYSSKKSVLSGTFEELVDAVHKSIALGANIGLQKGESVDQKLKKLQQLIFDINFESTLTQKSPGSDWVQDSGVNFYDRTVTLEEVKNWSEAGNEKNDLNSTVIKNAEGKLEELVWRAGTPDGSIAPGKYAGYLKGCIQYLEQAIPYASGDVQQETIRKLIQYFRTGELKDFHDFNVHWVGDKSPVDFILGFIEVYLDPRGSKAEYEGSVFWADVPLTASIQKIGDNAPYFEQKVPWPEKYRKTDVKPLTANVVNVIGSFGGSGPTSPIGINLPNEQAIRESHGSKSVVLENIVSAADKSGGFTLADEFCWDDEEKEAHKKYHSLADNLHTALHEVLGHASGKTSVEDPPKHLPGYYSTLEEARADLVALWHIWDPKLVELGIVENDEVAKQMYRQEIRNALLLQLRRVNEDQLEEDHMKNRQMNASYILNNYPKAIKKEERDGKTYFRVVDFDEMRRGVGELLTEVMRIKAEGDLTAAKNLIDTYGLKIDTKIRDEVMERVKKLNAPAYNAYVMPELRPVLKTNGEMDDVQVHYGLDLATQMLAFSEFGNQFRDK